MNKHSFVLIRGKQSIEFLSKETITSFLSDFYSHFPDAPRDFQVFECHSEPVEINF